MARPRKDGKRDLPKNLYESRSGYYAYNDKFLKKTRGLGRDRDAAIRYAIRMNESMGITEPDSPRGAGLNVGKLLESEYISGFAKSVKKLCGIYFLLQDGEIVYVGQSVNCTLRIGNHLADSQKIFDSYFIVECKECFLDELESSYIIKFQPKYNLVIPKIRKEVSRFMALVESVQSSA